MRVISVCSALLSDYEVLALLRDYEQEQVQAFRKKRRLDNDAELTLDQEEAMLRYLPNNLTDIQTNTTATLSERHRGAAHQSEEPIAAFKNALKEAGFAGPRGPDGRRSAILSKAEQLQIINHVPQATVELFTIIDNLEERMGVFVDTLLELIKEHLPTPLTAKKAMEDEEAALAAEEIRRQMEEADDDDEAMNQVPQANAAEEDADMEDEAIKAAADDFIHEGRGAAVDDDVPDED